MKLVTEAWWNEPLAIASPAAKILLVEGDTEKIRFKKVGDTEVVTWIDVSHLVTEDDTPVDNPFSEKQMRLAVHPLYASPSWSQGVPFVAMANVGLYFALNADPLVPDALVSMGVSLPEDLHEKGGRAYFHWVYGKSPDIVIEIVSNKEGGELTKKMRSYAHMGVPYYAVYDPETLIQPQRLQSFELKGSIANRVYEPMAEPTFHIEGVTLGLVVWEGVFERRHDHWLRWMDGKGQIIPTGEERADAEARRASEEGQRAAALAAKLRELGVDPESVTGA